MPQPIAINYPIARGSEGITGYINNGSLGDHSVALANLRNGMMTLNDQGQSNSYLITSLVRSGILETLRMIDAHHVAQDQ